MRLQEICKDYLNLKRSYTYFALRWFGMKGKITLLILNFIYSFGSCVSYISKFSSHDIYTYLLVMTTRACVLLVNKLFLSDSKYESNLNLAVIIILFFILSFLCLSDNVKNLKFSAYYGFVSIILMVLTCLLITAFNSFFDGNYDSDLFTFNYFSISSHKKDDFLNRVATIILSFSFHTYTFSIYENLDDRTTKKMMVSTCIGVLISSLSYLTIGATIYFSFGEKIFNFEDSIFEVLVTTKGGFALIIFFAINVLMSFPISFFSVKAYALYALPLVWELIKEMLAKIKAKVISCCKSEEVGKQKIIRLSNKGSFSVHQEKTKTINNDLNHSQLGQATDNDEHPKSSHEEEHDNEDENHHHHAEFSPFVSFIVIIVLFGLIYYICIRYGNSKYVSNKVMLLLL